MSVRWFDGIGFDLTTGTDGLPHMVVVLGQQNQGDSAAIQMPIEQALQMHEDMRDKLDQAEAALKHDLDKMSNGGIALPH